MSGMNLDIGPAVRALADEKERRFGAAAEAARGLAARMEAEARAHHPWTDRTGRARGAIEGRAEVNGARIVVSLNGGAPYAAALETGYGGRYAVIGPTVRKFAPGYLRALGGGEGA